MSERPDPDVALTVFGMACMAVGLLAMLAPFVFFALDSLFVPHPHPKSQPWAASVKAGIPCTVDSSKCAAPCEEEP